MPPPPPTPRRKNPVNPNRFSAAEAVARIERLAVDGRAGSQTLGGLTIEEKVELIAGIGRKPTLTAKDKTALGKLYTQTPLDTQFQNATMSERKIARIAAEIRQSATVEDWARIWSESLDPTEQKKRQLEKVLNAVRRAYGLPAGRVEIERGSRKDFEGMFVRTSVKDTVRVPLRSKAWENPDEALRLIIHEAIHTYQFDLIRRLDAGKIGQGDPRYVQALLFRLNFKGQRDVSLYLEGLAKQPLELHSGILTREVVRRFRRARR